MASTFRFSPSFSLLETITDLFLGSCGRFLISHAESICPSLRGPLSRVQLYSFPLTFCPFLFCFSRQLPTKPGAGSRCPRTVHRPPARVLSCLWLPWRPLQASRCSGVQPEASGTKNTNQSKGGGDGDPTGAQPSQHGCHSDRLWSKGDLCNCAQGAQGFGVRGSVLRQDASFWRPETGTQPLQVWLGPARVASQWGRGSTGEP